MDGESLGIAKMDGCVVGEGSKEEREGVALDDNDNEIANRKIPSKINSFTNHSQGGT